MSVSRVATLGGQSFRTVLLSEQFLLAEMLSRDAQSRGMQNKA